MRVYTPTNATAGQPGENASVARSATPPGVKILDLTQSGSAAEPSVTRAVPSMHAASASAPSNTARRELTDFATGVLSSERASAPQLSSSAPADAAFSGGGAFKSAPPLSSSPSADSSVSGAFKKPASSWCRRRFASRQLHIRLPSASDARETARPAMDGVGGDASTLMVSATTRSRVSLEAAAAAPAPPRFQSAFAPQTVFESSSSSAATQRTPAQGQRRGSNSQLPPSRALLHVPQPALGVVLPSTASPPAVPQPSGHALTLQPGAPFDGGEEELPSPVPGADLRRVRLQRPRARPPRSACGQPAAPAACAGAPPTSACSTPRTPPQTEPVDAEPDAAGCSLLAGRAIAAAPARGGPAAAAAAGARRGAPPAAAVAPPPSAAAAAPVAAALLDRPPPPPAPPQGRAGRPRRGQRCLRCSSAAAAGNPLSPQPNVRMPPSGRPTPSSRRVQGTPAERSNASHLPGGTGLARAGTSSPRPPPCSCTSCCPTRACWPRWRERPPARPSPARARCPCDPGPPEHHGHGAYGAARRAVAHRAPLPSVPLAAGRPPRAPGLARERQHSSSRLGRTTPAPHARIRLPRSGSPAGVERQSLGRAAAPAAAQATPPLPLQRQQRQRGERVTRGWLAQGGGGHSGNAQQQQQPQRHPGRQQASSPLHVPKTPSRTPTSARKFFAQGGAVATPLPARPPAGAPAPRLAATAHQGGVGRERTSSLAGAGIGSDDEAGGPGDDGDAATLSARRSSLWRDSADTGDTASTTPAWLSSRLLPPT